MKEKDVLYFEEDDASQLGANGKQVFMTKRINGKTEHNKMQDSNQGMKLNKNEEKENNDEDEITVELDRFYTTTKPKLKKENQSNKKKTTKTNNKNYKNNQNNLKNQKSRNNQKNLNSKKRRKKKKKKSKILTIIILLIIIAGTIVFAMVSPVFNIETITVQGNEKIETETIVSLSELQIGKNIFQNSKSEIIKKIKEEPYIENVKVKRKLPGTIEISVEERKTQYQVQVINSYVYLDYQGYILEIASEKTDVPILSGLETSQNDLLNGERIASGDISKLNTLLKIVENAKTMEVYDLITQINTENNEYVLYMQSEKKYIYLGDGSDITNKMTYVKLIVQNEQGKSGKAIINGNLEDGFKPYFSEENIE